MYVAVQCFVACDGVELITRVLVAAELSRTTSMTAVRSAVTLPLESSDLRTAHVREENSLTLRARQHDPYYLAQGNQIYAHPVTGKDGRNTLRPGTSVMRAGLPARQSRRNIRILSCRLIRDQLRTQMWLSARCGSNVPVSLARIVGAGLTYALAGFSEIAARPVETQLPDVATRRRTCRTGSAAAPGVIPSATAKIVDSDASRASSRAFDQIDILMRATLHCLSETLAARKIPTTPPWATSVIAGSQPSHGADVPWRS